MGERNMELYVDGTSALKLSGFELAVHEPNIIPFDSRAAKTAGPQRESDTGKHKSPRRNAGDALRHVLDASEMYCSLRYEDARGCPYDLFTKHNIAALAAGSTVLGVISLVFGA